MLFQKASLVEVFWPLDRSYFFHNSLERLASEDRLTPLVLSDYQSVNGTDYEPHVLRVFEHREHYLTFSIRLRNGHFITRVSINSLDALPDLQTLLIDSAGFQKSQDVQIVQPMFKMPCLSSFTLWQQFLVTIRLMPEQARFHHLRRWPEEGAAAASHKNFSHLPCSQLICCFLPFSRGKLYLIASFLSFILYRI